MDWKDDFAKTEHASRCQLQDIIRYRISPHCIIHGWDRLAVVSYSLFWEYSRLMLRIYYYIFIQSVILRQRAKVKQCRTPLPINSLFSAIENSEFIIFHFDILRFSENAYRTAIILRLLLLLLRCDAWWQVFSILTLPPFDIELHFCAF